jgi:endonuclease V-like protein UPF0215 family
LRRALGKSHLRVLALDDGAFSRRQRRAPLIAVVWSSPDRIEGIQRSTVTVDGTDATERALALIRAAPQYEGIKVVLVDGVVVGGFNVLDLRRLAHELRRPVVAVTRRPPDDAKIAAAVRKYFPRDARRRLALLRRNRLFRVPTGATPLLAAAVGLGRPAALEVLRRCTVRGHWPEPLRIAHLVGHAFGTRSATAGPRVRTNP